MAFSELTDPGKTADELGLLMKNGDLLTAAPPLDAPDWLARQLHFHLFRTKRPFSGMYAREYLISPLFSFLQMKYERLNMFSNDFPLGSGARLSGIPDYLLSYPTEEGVYSYAAQFPLLAVAEAKNETFNAGSGRNAPPNSTFAASSMKKREKTAAFRSGESLRTA